ncbi:hypothetical protein JTB14_024425 [Gonioctena quinquepunctata]|nr:hypothetical protein JTB14_024425 [Gonioctena quinquepunctata]
MTVEKVQVIVGNIIHCKGKFEVQVLDRGFIIFQGSKMLAIGEEADLSNTKMKLNLNANFEKTILKSSQIIIPGLIDTHIHAPQYPNCGLGYDKPLLEWLDTYTYKLEKQYRDQDFSKKAFKGVVKKTIDHGTTTACYFGSMFNKTTEILVDTVIEYGQRALVGKLNMTTLAPDDYIEKPKESISNTIDFIRFVESKKTLLVKPIITPRFALSLDMDSMKELGKIAQKEKLHIQSHIAENTDEVNSVQSKFQMPYADVYDKANLLTSKTILAHGIYLSNTELKLLAERKTSISHCPESNTCLKSGLCDVRRLLDFGLEVGLGTDVSGGPSPSIVRAMRAALDVSIHLSFQEKCYVPLTYEDVFYLATLGGAKALSMDAEIGSFQPGKQFDALIVDMDVDNCSADHILNCSPLELLQKFIYTGDDRNIVNVYVAGTVIK